MTDDLVKRLRKLRDDNYTVEQGYFFVLTEAADEIVRLREALTDIAEQTGRSTTITQLDVNRIAAEALGEQL